VPFDGWVVVQSGFTDVPPSHGKRIPPAASEPTVIHHDTCIFHEGSKTSLVFWPVFHRFLPQKESILERLNRVTLSTGRHEVLAVVRKGRFEGRTRGIPESILESPDWKAGVIGIPWDEGTPPSQLDRQR
jgi:hypothetical protein